MSKRAQAGGLAAVGAVGIGVIGTMIAIFPSSPVGPTVGGVYTVPASFGGTTITTDCSTGVAGAINGWLATIPDGSTAAFAAGACYGLNNPLQLINQNNITVQGNGATFKLLPAEGTGGAYLTPWVVLGGTNINLINMTLVGASAAPASCASGSCGTDKICYPNSTYEFQYGIEYAGTVGGAVTGVNMSQMCGEFIDFYPACSNSTFTAFHGCTGTNIWTQPCQNITINGGTESVAGQQGIVITDAENVTAYAVSMSYVGANGVDIEPDTTLGYTNNITINNNTFKGISGSMFNESGGGDLGSGDVTVTNNTQTLPQSVIPAIAVYASGVSPVPSGFTFTGNTFAAFGWQFDAEYVDNVDIENNTNTYKGGTYGFNYSITAGNVDTITFMNNVVYGGATTDQPTSIFKSTTGVTNITNCGNTTFTGPNQPSGC